MLTLHSVLVDLLYLLASGAIAFVAPRVTKFYMAHTTAEQRAILTTLAEAAIPFIERAFPALDGPAKMQEAIAWVNNELTKLGIPLSAADIEAALEKAYADAKAKGILAVYAKPAPAPAPSPDPSPAPAPSPTPATD